MNINRQNIKQLSCLIASVMIVFALCSTFTSLSYAPNGNLLLASGVTGSSANNQEPLIPIRNWFYLTDFSVSEVAALTNLTLVSSRQIRVWQRFLNSAFNIQTSSLVCTALFMYSFLILIRKMNKHISVIALLIGGHAPPMI